jgi:hypothetical protein
MLALAAAVFPHFRKRRLIAQTVLTRLHRVECRRPTEASLYWHPRFDKG